MALQVAVLTCYRHIELPPFAALRHLILCATSPGNLPNTTLQNATALETLSLCNFDRYADWSHTIDFSSLYALKHMRIENVAPRMLHLPEGCLLHVMWNGRCTDDSGFRQWAQVQSLWQGHHCRLGSLDVCLEGGEFQDVNMALLKRMLTGHQELAYISLWIPELGTEKQPFLVDPRSCQMLAHAERVRFRAEKSCSISVVDMHPKWKNLSIDAARVNLEVRDMAALVRSLDNFWIEGVSIHGILSLSMMHELYRSERKCWINSLTIEFGDDTRDLQGFQFATLHGRGAQRRFKELMCCGCSSCLDCLSREGKLSRDSRRPKNCWREPAYEYAVFS